jgi:N-acetylmuramoyl-L-alanine amidase
LNDPRKPGAPAEVTAIRHWSSAESSTVAIDLQDQVQYEAHHLADPERIYFDLHDTSLSAAISGKTIAVDDAFLVRVRVAQPEAGLTRVVLETKGNPTYSVSLQPNPYRLLVEIRRQGAPQPTASKIDLFAPVIPATFSTAHQNPAAAKTDQKGSPALAGPQPATSAGKPRSSLPRLRIVLDAGHGGWDLGTVGRKGLLEKDLVLDIVNRLGKLIEGGLDAEVIYTRQDDTYLPLEKRAEIANLSHGNLFLSVHANYSDSASARGVETYYTNTYSSVRARMAEASGDGVALQSVDWTNVDIREKVRESHRFAACIQRALYGTLETKNPGLRDRGVKEASYVVLTGTSMPAVLAEVSFVSSPTDESELRNTAYRQQIAEALYKGLAHYRAESLPKVKIASTSDQPARKQ